jgi:hypothetical protein
MSNETNAATAFETLGVDYKEVNEDFARGLLMKNMAYSARLAVALSGKVNASTLQWAESVNADVHVAFEPLARGHVANWFQADDAKAALRSFKFARSAIDMVSQKFPILSKSACFIRPTSSVLAHVALRASVMAILMTTIPTHNSGQSCLARGCTLSNFCRELCPRLVMLYQVVCVSLCPRLGNALV